MQPRIRVLDNGSLPVRPAPMPEQSRDMRPFMERLALILAMDGRNRSKALDLAHGLLKDLRDFGRDPAGYVRHQAMRRAAVILAQDTGQTRLPARVRLACSLEAQVQVAQGVPGFRPTVLEALAAASLQVRWVGLDMTERMEFLADLAARFGRFRQWAAAELDLGGPERLALELLVREPAQVLAAKRLLEASQRLHVRGRKNHVQVIPPQAMEMLEHNPVVRCLRRILAQGRDQPVKGSGLVDGMKRALVLAEHSAWESGWAEDVLQRVYTAVDHKDLGWVLLPPGLDKGAACKALRGLARNALVQAAASGRAWGREQGAAVRQRPLVATLGQGVGEMGFLDIETREPLHHKQGLITAMPEHVLRIMAAQEDDPRKALGEVGGDRPENEASNVSGPYLP